MDPTNTDILRDISEKRKIIRLLKRKAFPWTMMYLNGYAFDKGLGKNETGPLINQTITETSYNPLNLYAFQKRVSFKLDERSSRSIYHKKVKIHAFNWIYCPSNCKCRMQTNEDLKSTK